MLLSLCLMTFVALSTGCDRRSNPISFEHLPDEMFKPQPEYAGPLETLGDLSAGYLNNTTSLRQANNQILVLCQAAGRCEGPL